MHYPMGRVSGNPFSFPTELARSREAEGGGVSLLSPLLISPQLSSAIGEFQVKREKKKKMKGRVH